MKVARPHQKAANDATFEFVTTRPGNPMVVIPVGGGKSFVMADFILRVLAAYAGARFIVLAHVSTLLEQNAAELLGLWPGADISFYSDKLGQKRLTGQVVFASIQSIYKKALQVRGVVDFVLIDECHLISPDASTMYRRFLADLRLNSPCVRVIGYTGTPFRAGSGYLHEGENALFSDIAYEVEIGALIEQGYLCPLVTPRMRTQIDTSGVAMRGGDFVASELARAADQEGVTEACVDEIVEHGAARRKWLIFAASVEHSEHIRDAVRRRGITCEAVHSRLSNEEQADVLRRFETDAVRCLTNVAQLTTGYNNPAIDLLAFMRPTRSPVLYIQCCGRAMRLSPGKADAVVLDFGGVVEALGPIDRIEVRRRKGKGGPTPFRRCPECGAENATAVRLCRECGHEFPPPQVALNGTASNAAILSSQQEPKRLPVTRVLYHVHKKEGKPDSLRVEYLCGLARHSEWVCLNHSGFPREQAARWWAARAPGMRTPSSVAEAINLTPSLPIPSSILVKKAGKYWEIVGHEFEQPATLAG